MSTYRLRLADHLMEAAKAAAAEDNVSLDQLFATFIAEGIGHRRALLELRKLAGRGDVAAAALAVLERVADADPDPGDELPGSARRYRKAR